MSSKWAIVIHGGASAISPTRDHTKYLAGLRVSLNIGREILESAGSALDAVEKAVISLEDNELFNAGRGAVYTRDGKHELEASIMDGSTLQCGAVTGLRTVKNPIHLARLVMEKVPHIFLGFDAAEEFATNEGVERVEQSYYDTTIRFQQFQAIKNEEHSFGTVGAVAVDQFGNVAAATSTGGLSNKWAGRISDSPIIGAGTYANNNTCAVSGTGIGEEFIRHHISAAISTGVEFGLSLEESVNRAVHKTLKQGDGGVIAVDRNVNVAMAFNTLGMYRGFADYTGQFQCLVKQLPEQEQ